MAPPPATELHKRLITLATIGGVMPAAVGHFAGHNFRSAPALLLPMLAVTFVAPAIYDRIRLGRFNRVTLWGCIVLFAWGNVRAVFIRPSAAWQQVMAWLAS